MGEGDGTMDSRVSVAVSESMGRLRQTQGVLNGFWQTSDLAYGYFLSQAASVFADEQRRTVELLGHIESQVWYPNDQGRIKRDDTIGSTLKQVRENNMHLYRATLLSFFAAFEVYLDERVAPLDPQVRSWGPYVRSLSVPSLTKIPVSVRLRTMLCADFSREIRNKIVHEAFSVPTSLDDQAVSEWKHRLYDHACRAGWSQDAVDAEMKYTANHVIGKAINYVEEARKQGKDLPIELFYMLFTFANLDSLAFEIEEALQPVGSRTGVQISRKEEAVRRKDLIIGPAA
jgi:hypothetical protein